MSRSRRRTDGCTPREMLLVASARAVLAALADSKGDLGLSTSAKAALRLLKGALLPYLDPPPPADRRK